MTTTQLPTALEQRRLEAEALAEHREWMRRLELERWTHSHQTPENALRTLVAREGIRLTTDSAR